MVTSIKIGVQKTVNKTLNCFIFFIISKKKTYIQYIRILVYLIIELEDVGSIL